MSRLPPLPPGLPPRPHYPRPSSREGESYRPRDDYYSQDESRTSYAPRPPPQQYQFRGSNGYDSRPDYGRRSPSRRRSPQGRRSPPRHNYPTGDSYRPRDDGFTFRHDAPPGVDFGRGDAYRPRSPPPNSFRSREDQTYSSRLRDVPKHHDGSRSRGARAGRAGYRGRGGPRRAADRDFLQTNRAPTPERMIGMDEEKGNGSRYRALDEMSISDDDDATDDSTGPRKKKSRSDNKAADGDSVPRWSNPDPYTALPPPDETQRKKKDVVKLIRKARVTDGADGSTKAGAATDDFISFDLDDEEGVMKPDVSHDLVPMFGVPVNAPAGPRAPAQQKRQADMPQSSHQGSLPDTKSNPVKIDIRHRLPNKPARTAVVDLTSDPALGNRKRTHRDEIKLEAPRALNNSFGGKKPAVHGGVTPMWKVKIGSNSTPWIELDHSNSANMGLWMHKEIVDFYYYVKPRAFEQAVRTKLVEDLRLAARSRFPAYDILTFGSFPAGLYLPTSDMDLVCVSDNYMRTGRVANTGKRHLYNFGQWLRETKIAHDDSVTVVAGAKVPLVKYVDRLTGLKVDISFENDTGLIANKTFQEWKHEFPAMPTLVTIIKHLLAMRGLNEPQNGGIGGFSVICLVVSLLQNMPQVQSRSMIPEHHYGEVLMEFLDLYGNQFNVTTTAISLKPPGYVPKSQAHNIVYKRNNMDRFSILDPNRPDNDISGGSSNTRAIMQCFSDAHSALQRRIGQLQSQPERAKESILGCILEGDYGSFDIQRSHLAIVHEHTIGPLRD